MSDPLGGIRDRFKAALLAVNSVASLDKLKSSLLGKNGELTIALQGLSSLPAEQRKQRGAELNRFKQEAEAELSRIKKILEAEELQQELLKNCIDVTLPARAFHAPSAHPITQTLSDIKNIMIGLGFHQADGPEIEDDWHNFGALNIAESHPARQMHDTFYLKESKLLLRTHTSSVQIRYMENHRGPARIFSTGRVYRADDDATHTPMFHQLEVLCVDQELNIGHLKYMLEQFLKQFFQLDHLPIRLRPSFFPFTTPSMEVDVLCDRSSKKSIIIGQGNNWLEILGCGMVHPTVLTNMGIDPNKYRGFAFGAGIERLAMLKYRIPDLRLLFNGTPWVATN